MIVGFGRAAAYAKRHGRALVASVAFLLALFWLLRAGGLPLLPPAKSLARVELVPVLSMAALLLLSILLRIVRCHFLLAPIAPVSLHRLISISCLSLGLLTFLPFRLGEFARPALLRQKGKLSGWAITGTVGAERIIDGVVFSVSLLVGLWFAIPHEPLPDHIGSLPVPAALVPKVAKLAALGFGAAFLVMVGFYCFRSFARRVLERTLRVVSPRFATRMADTVERVSDGLRFLRDLRHGGPFLLTTIAGIFTHAFGLMLLAKGVGLPPLSLPEALVVLGVLGLGFAMPNAPGFFGTIQLALYAGLAVYFDPAHVIDQGAAFVFVFYVTYIGLVVLLTLYGLLAETLPAGESVFEGSSRPHGAVEKHGE